VAKHGFVYILGNSAMPGRYKVGFTMNSPFQRAEELSRATGVPCDFAVLGFIAVQDPQKHEAEMHRRFAASREEGKEFFQCPLEALWRALCENEYRQAECNVEIEPWCAYEDVVA
jgi:hypothetical protein